MARAYHSAHHSRASANSREAVTPTARYLRDRMERDPEQETAFRWGLFTGLRFGFALGLVAGAASHHGSRYTHG